MNDKELRDMSDELLWEIALSGGDDEQSIDRVVSFVNKVREQDVIDWLSKQDIVEVQKFFAVIMYRYIMHPTNATKVDIKLDRFSQDGKVLGDLEITAQLNKG